MALNLFKTYPKTWLIATKPKIEPAVNTDIILRYLIFSGTAKTSKLPTSNSVATKKQGIYGVY